MNTFRSSISHIPVPAFLQDLPFGSGTLGVDEPGFFGAIIVLLNDGGHISSGGIKAGHDTLNQGVQAALDSLILAAAPTGGCAYPAADH